MMQFIPLRPLQLLALLVLLATVVTSGCTTAPGRTTGHDPFQKFNRGVYRFNDVLDRGAIKPLAKGYQTITTSWMRSGVSNFFGNLGIPWVMVNELLQGKPKLMAEQTCRLVVNTVVGVGGLFDVASKLNLPAEHEDFGQTLAVWGVPSGPYLLLPFFGPASVRDGFGKVPDYFARPSYYVQIPWETNTALTVLEIAERREVYLAVDGTLKNAYDPYGVIRDIWVQQRQYEIYDGNPPYVSLEDESVDPDAPAANEPSGASATEAK